MTHTTEAQDRIKRYLWEVAGYLQAMAPVSRIEMLQDLESHLYEALAARSASPTRADVDAVLAAMPPPSSYGNDSAPPRPQPSAARLTWNELPGTFLAWSRTIAWEGIGGLALLVFGLSLFVRGIVFTFFAHYYHDFALSMGAPRPFIIMNAPLTYFGIVLIFLAVSCFAIAVTLGRKGMRRIIDSKWKLSGFLPAFIAYLAPRLLLYDGLGLLAFSVLVAIGASKIVFFTIAVLFLLYVGNINFYLVKREWREWHQQ